MKRLLEEATRLIKINSVSNYGNEEIANYVFSLMEARGLKTTMQHIAHSYEKASKKQFNVIGTLGDPLVDRKIKKGILLVSSLDTAEAGQNSAWTKTGNDPFQLTLLDDKVYGLGVTTGKIDFLCKLFAIQKFRDSKLKMPVYLVGVGASELGGLGAKFLIQSHVLNPAAVVLGAPTHLGVVTDSACYMNVKVKIAFHVVDRDARGFNRKVNLIHRGRTASGTSQDFSMHSLIRMVEFINQTLESGFEIRLSKLFGGSTLNQMTDRAEAEFYLTTHQFEDFKRYFRERAQVTKEFELDFGGLGDVGISFIPESAFNLLTEVLNLFLKNQFSSQGAPLLSWNWCGLEQELRSVDLCFGIQLNSSMTEKDVVKELTAHIQKLSAKYPPLNVNVEKPFSRPSTKGMKEGRLFRECMDIGKKMHLKPQVQQVSFSTDAGYFTQKDFETIIFGPGEFDKNAYCPNEFCSVSDIEKAVSFYEEIISQYCLN